MDFGESFVHRIRSSESSQAFYRVIDSALALFRHSSVLLVSLATDDAGVSDTRFANKISVVSSIPIACRDPNSFLARCNSNL